MSGLTGWGYCRAPSAIGEPRDHRRGEIQDRALALSGLHVAEGQDRAGGLSGRAVVRRRREQAETCIGGNDAAISGPSPSTLRASAISRSVESGLSTACTCSKAWSEMLVPLIENPQGLVTGSWSPRSSRVQATGDCEFAFGSGLVSNQPGLVAAACTGSRSARRGAAAIAVPQPGCPAEQGEGALKRSSDAASCSAVCRSSTSGTSLATHAESRPDLAGVVGRGENEAAEQQRHRHCHRAERNPGAASAVGRDEKSEKSDAGSEKTQRVPHVSRYGCDLNDGAKPWHEHGN